MKQVPTWRLKTGTPAERELAAQFMLSTADVMAALNSSRSQVIRWSKTGRLGELLRSNREVIRVRATISFRVHDVDLFARHQHLPVDWSTLHPFILAKAGIELDPLTGVRRDSAARLG